jgi:inner membrane protein
VLPDADVLAFSLGIPYEHPLGHRGMSHSFAFAAMVALFGAWARRILQTTFARAFLFLCVATGSHGVLDAFTNGGLGIAFFWPWSETRYFFPFFRPLVVSPIGMSDFLPYAKRVLVSELLCVWVPVSLAAWGLAVYRRRL